MREITIALFDTQPFRSLAVSLSRFSGGRRFLTSLHPRRGIYESFPDAWKAAGLGRHPGHDHPEAVERHVVIADTPMPSDYAVLYWLEKIAGDIRLFDYGGNMGNVFYGCARYIDTAQRRLQWTVYDLPQVIRMAVEKAARQDRPAPIFTTSLQDAAGANVLLVSGTYHYWEKDTKSFLEQFPRLPEHVFINRSPFYDDREPVVSMQSTLNFAFPMAVKNVRELLDGFTGKGYALVDRWTAAEYGHVMPFFPDQSVRSYSGFYFRLKPVDQRT